MPGFTEADLVGRKIDKLFISSPLPMDNTGRAIFTCGTVPEIAPSGKTAILFVGVVVSANGTTGATTLGFGTTLGGTEWTGSQFNVDAYSESPKVFFPANGVSTRPTVYANGTVFYTAPGAGGAVFNAGATAVITLYGFTY
jgi:hypothetical protein